MKKIYLKPETQCIDIKMQPLMDGSVTGVGGADGLGVGGDTSDAGITEGGSRGFFWEDEE